MGYERVKRLGARSSRRRATRSILEPEGGFAQLLKAGEWRSSAYRQYLDSGAGGPPAVERVLIEASDDEAEPAGTRSERAPLGPRPERETVRGFFGSRFPLISSTFQE